MGEAAIRLTVWSVSTVIWYMLIDHATNWSAALVFLLAVVLGACTSIIDIIFFALIDAIFGDS